MYFADPVPVNLSGSVVFAGGYAFAFAAYGADHADFQAAESPPNLDGDAWTRAYFPGFVTPTTGTVIGPPPEPTPNAVATAVQLEASPASITVTFTGPRVDDLSSTYLEISSENWTFDTQGSNWVKYTRPGTTANQDGNTAIIHELPTWYTVDSTTVTGWTAPTITIDSVAQETVDLNYIMLRFSGDIAPSAFDATTFYVDDHAFTSTDIGDDEPRNYLEFSTVDGIDAEALVGLEWTVDSLPASVGPTSGTVVLDSGMRAVARIRKPLT